MKIRTFVLVLLTALLLSGYGCDTPASDTDSGTMFPPGNLESARRYAMEEQAGTALLIWQNGDLVLETYSGETNGSTPRLLFSGSKSFAGILAAIGVKNGLFTFDTPLGDLISGWDSGSERGSVTVRELLNLTSGLETAPAGSWQTPSEWLHVKSEFARGEQFRYGPTPFYIFSWIFHNELGIHPVNYLDQHLFAPLGAGRGEWLTMDEGITNFSFGGIYPALDWLQIGKMLLNRGSLRGKEIIPEEIFGDLLVPSEAAPGYGITFWLNGQSQAGPDKLNHRPDRYISAAAPPDLFMKSGLFGQRLFMIPSLDLVIVRFGSAGSSFDDDTFLTILLNGVDIPA